MKTYLNKSGRSGVKSYNIDADKGEITVQFKTGEPYTYTKEDNGDYLISRMSAMGNNGEYLNRLINAEQPKYVGQKESSLMGNMQHALRPSDEKQMIAIHNKYQWRNESGPSQLKRALEEKQRKAPTYAEFNAYRKLSGKLR